MLTQLSALKIRLGIDEFEIKYDTILATAQPAIASDKRHPRPEELRTMVRMMITAAGQNQNL